MQISETKADLRKLALARRAAVASDATHAFSILLEREGLALAKMLENPAVSVYWPIRNEADTRLLLAALAAQGFATALPVTGARGTALVFRAWTHGDPQNPGQMGIPEPLLTAPSVEPDMLFVPLAAFDRRGHRIGYGAGHYDCTLAQLRRKKPVLAIGIGYATQEIAQVPEDVHDQRLDFVLTERELIDCRT